MQQESLYDTFPIDKLIEYCGGSLTLLIVMMMILETRQFRNTCHNSREAYSSAVVVIYNVVLQKCPYANPMALNNVQTKGYSFLMSVIDPYAF